jgi:hypothetical protein
MAGSMQPLSYDFRETAAQPVCHSLTFVQHIVLVTFIVVLIAYSLHMTRPRPKGTTLPFGVSTH